MKKIINCSISTNFVKILMQSKSIIYKIKQSYHIISTELNDA